MYATFWFISFLFFLGITILYWRNRRKFDRKNEQGIEQFGSYLKKVKSEAFDKLLLWIGNASIITGSGLFIYMLIESGDLGADGLGWMVVAFVVLSLIAKPFEGKK